MIKTILLDLDCVLAHFVEGLARLWGTTSAKLETFQPIGQYDYKIALTRYRAIQITELEFWKSIESKVGFWTNLPEFPWTHELLDLVRSTTDNWYVVSSPSRCPRCIPEKREWLHRVLKVDWFDRLIPTPHKELMSKPGVVLIDDYDYNCAKFIKEGGHAITFPTHHNGMNHYKDDPILFVRAALDSYQRNS